MTDFVHLRIYTEYSLLYSAIRLSDLTDYLLKAGSQAVGIADYGMMGALSFYRACQDRGIKPILGQTIAIVHDRSRRPAEKPSELLLLAKDDRGYATLCQLATLAYTAPEVMGKKVNTWKEIALHHEGLFCLTGGAKGPLESALAKGKEQALRALEQLTSWFGQGNVYVELLATGDCEDATIMHRHARLAQEAGYPTVATSISRHVMPQDVRYLDVLSGIAYGTTVEEEAKARHGITYEIKERSAFTDLFANYPDAIQNTIEIANRVQLSISLHQVTLPHFKLDDQDPIESQEALLTDIARRGLLDRVPEVNETYRQRLEDELAIIHKLGFAGYFLIVWDFVRYAKMKGISVGPGRGSAAGSLVAYALSITDVDPVAYHLLFERFLNPERISWPDIDIDFETERRYEVIHYVMQKYGDQHVAQIGTMGTLAARAAIRDVARTLSLPQQDIQPIIDKIPNTPGVRLERVIAENASLSTMIKQSPVLTRVIELALGIEGLSRHTSVHAAGVVISRYPLATIAPLMQGAEEMMVTQYSMEDIEALGLLKMDFLGLRTLTILDRAKAAIRKTRGIAIKDEMMILDDATRELLAHGDTDGCFQLESTGVKNVLKAMQPQDIEDLIAVISLYRPGPMEQIDTFLKARRGEIPIVYEVPALAPILAPTYGIIVYQEQIMQIANVMAGFSLGQADVLRRAVSKKKREVLDASRIDFVAGCLAQGHDEASANHVYDWIVRFADYGFNRSHAAAYAVLAIRTAYLKANYRPEFMAALMTDSFSRPDKVAQYAASCRRAGILLLPPDVNLSDQACTSERLADGRYGVRLGLLAIKNVGYNAVLSILAAREKAGAFTSLSNLFAKTDSRSTTKRVVQSLIQAGACSSLGPSRQTLLMALEKISMQPRESRQLSLLTDQEDKEQLVMYPDDEEEIEAWERDLIGFVVAKDPYRLVLAWQVYEHARSLDDYLDGPEGSQEQGVVKLVGKAATMRSVKTKKGDTMGFITLDDGTAMVDIVLFASVYRLLPSFDKTTDVLKIDARRDAQNPRKMIAVKVAVLQGEVPESSSQVMTLFLKINAKMEQDHEQLAQVRRLLLAHSGAHDVVLVYASGKVLSLSTIHVDLTESLLFALRRLLGEDAVKIERKNKRSDD